MKAIRNLFLLGLISASSFSGMAQTTPGSGSVADLNFISGKWLANTPEGQSIEGVWLEPKSDNILGFMRMMRGGKAELYEMLAYEKSGEGLISLVKHFRPGLVGLEEKDKQDRYLFIEASKGRAIFEKDDGGLRILYEQRSKKQFVIARGNKEDGKWVYKDLFVFNRQK